MAGGQGGDIVATAAEMLGVAPEAFCRPEEIDRTGDRVILRLKWAPRFGPAGCVRAKCGQDGGIAAEAAALAGFYASGDPVPPFLGYRRLGGNGHLALTGWVEGRHPDFARREDVGRVFGALGGWMGRCSRTVARGPGGAVQPARPIPPALRRAWAARAGPAHTERWYRRRLEAFVRRASSRPDLLQAVGGPGFPSLYAGLGAHLPALARRIAGLPSTLDPGDFTPGNALLGPAGDVCFLDFEFAALRSLARVLENLDEPWPEAARGANADLALASFFDAYAAAGAPAVAWDAFVAAHRCARLFKRLRELDDLLGCLAGARDPQDVEQARRYARDTAAVFAAGLGAL